MAKFFTAPHTASLNDPHSFEEGDQVFVEGTDEIGSFVELRRGPTPMAIVEYENGARVEVPTGSVHVHVPEDVPDTWPTDPDDHTAGWRGPQWLKTRAFQSAWIDGEHFATEHEVGDEVVGPLGPVTIKAVGHSPMGTVYRVAPHSGAEGYDLMESEIQSGVDTRQLALARWVEIPD